MVTDIKKIGRFYRRK